MSEPDVSRLLEELITALDRRVPRGERAGEADIARDAATLRARAIERLAELSANGDVLPPGGGGGDRT